MNSRDPLYAPDIGLAMMLSSLMGLGCNLVLLMLGFTL